MRTVGTYINSYVGDEVNGNKLQVIFGCWDGNSHTSALNIMSDYVCTCKVSQVLLKQITTLIHIICDLRKCTVCCKSVVTELQLFATELHSWLNLTAHYSKGFACFSELIALKNVCCPHPADPCIAMHFGKWKSYFQILSH